MDEIIKSSEPQVDVKVDLRPTLFIGAGGTGMEVMLRIRRRILSAVWNRQHPVRVESIGEFPVARFLHLDLDSGAVIDEGKSQRTDPWYSLVKFGDDERLVEPFDIAQYHESDDSLARFPLIEKWMPLRPKKLRSLGIDPAKGAGQVRAVSRLYLFDQYPKLVGRIKGALGYLRSNAGNARKETYQRLGLQIDPSKFRIVVIASCAGGTGAGTLLDLGWLAKAIARQEVASSQVDLIMLMPAGYAKANKERTEANAYATMMELETAMRDMSAEVRWAEIDSLKGQGAPFDDVYMIDTANLAHKATEEVSDVYEMLAEVLFEDFASADFANKKRSVAVNQAQHKLGPYNPPVPEQRFGAMRLSYFKGYSALGQSILDTQQGLRDDIRAYELAALMVKAFFGVLGKDGVSSSLAGSVGGGGARRAGDAERDVFVREQLHLSEQPFDVFPDFKKGTIDVTPFQEYALVDLLLQDKDQRSLLERLESKVQFEIERIMAGFKIELWREKISELLPNLERDAIREAGAVAETSEDRIKRHTHEVSARLKKKAREQVYALLDDRKQGGLEFVLSLLEQIKARLLGRDHALLERNSKRYREIRDVLRTRQIEESLGNLSQAAGKFINKETQAREVMGHLKRDIADYLRFHLRAVAATQALEVLHQISAWLGEVQSIDANGQAQWNGMAGELQAGRRSVDAILQQVDQRILQLREDAKHEHATYIKLASDNTLPPVTLSADVSAWSEEVLAEFGGSEQLFPQLSSEEMRASLLLKLFRRAQAELARQPQDEQALPDPLLEKLQSFTPQERQRIFNEWIKSAMPWVNTRFSAEFTPRSDQFKCFIGVSDPQQWRVLEEEVRLALPGGYFTGDKINIVNTGMPGRAVCYIELSGFPMTVLRGLPTWRSSYQIENPRIPTHLHFDATRFRHPIAPSMDQLQSLADDFEIYLQAIACGLLQRKTDLADREARFQPQGQYLFEVEPGEWRQMGNEFSIRANGLPVHYREQIIAAVQQKTAQLSAPQLFLLAALMRHYAQRVYRPRLEVNESGVQIPSPSLPCITAQRLQQQWFKRANAMQPDLDGTRMEQVLADIHDWSETIVGSHQDCFAWEVEVALDKRVLGAAYLADASLAAHRVVPGAGASKTHLAVPAHMSPNSMLRFKVFLNKKQHGPYTLDQLQDMIAKGEVDGQTKVWNMAWHPQKDKWQLACECAEVAALLADGIPDPDDESGDDIPDPE
jgi:Tubulin like/GYF domain 2